MKATLEHRIRTFAHFAGEAADAHYIHLSRVEGGECIQWDKDHSPREQAFELAELARFQFESGLILARVYREPMVYPEPIVWGHK